MPHQGLRTFLPQASTVTLRNPLHSTQWSNPYQHLNPTITYYIDQTNKLLHVSIENGEFNYLTIILTLYPMREHID